MATAGEKLSLAEKHLAKVQVAWDSPTDWDDLSIYGFLCLEAAVEAAAIFEGLATTRKHWQKALLASDLHQKCGLTDISGLLTDLNQARKASGYGDVPLPSLDAEDVAVEIEGYVEEVKKHLGI